MKYFYNHAVLPTDKHLLTEIELAADRLSRRLLTLNPKELGISEYTQKYLRGYLQGIRGVLQTNSYLLAWALTNTQIPRGKFVFVDYGGGCGILSLLATELGIGTVIYNDIYDVSCRDAQRIAEVLQLQAQAYVYGDINELIKYLHHNTLSVNAIASYDVIEHIYDIGGYLRQLSSLSRQALRIVFASGANRHNPWVCRRIMQSHREVEYFHRKKTWGHKERDALDSYLAIRKKIVSACNSTLSEEQVDLIAKATRGLIERDIEQCVEEYNRTGKISYTPDHPTNTCDPYTGNWNEHLMETASIERIFREECFDVKIMNGYYAFSSQWYKQAIKHVLNLAISILGKNGIVLAPYYIVYAQRPASGV